MTQALVPTSERPRRGILRELLVGAGALSVAAALPSAMHSSHNDDGWALILVMSGLALASYPMSRAQNFLAQLFARAIWWQALAFGLVLALGYATGDVNGPISAATPMYVFGGLLAIVGAGRVGLDFESDHFAPVAFRGSLTASLVMAMADTIALLFYAGIVIIDGSFFDAFAFTGSAAVMLVAIAGLYRIKVWGLALNVGANILIAGLAISGVFQLPEAIAFGLVATAIGQLLLPIPLLKRMASKSADS